MEDNKWYLVRLPDSIVVLSGRSIGIFEKNGTAFSVIREMKDAEVDSIDVQEMQRLNKAYRKFGA